MKKALALFVVLTVLLSAVTASAEGFTLYLPIAFSGGPVAPSPTVEPTATTPARGRIPTGENQKAHFFPGEEVVGWSIELASGAKCTGGNCWLPKAPEEGDVLSGVINPWSSELPEVPWVPTPPPTATATATATSVPTNTLTVEPTATTEPTATVEATATDTPTATPERRPSGDGQTIVFLAGESVVGYKIVLLPSGRTCDGGSCYLPSAPEAGTVTTGVVNPWSTEVEGLTPWVPE